MSRKISRYRPAKAENRYLAACEAGRGLWPVLYESLDVTTRYGG